MSSEELPNLIPEINPLSIVDSEAQGGGYNESGQLPGIPNISYQLPREGNKPPNSFMDRRQSDIILLAHVRATFASLDDNAKRRYIYNLIHEQDQLSMSNIKKMLGLTAKELAKLQRELD